MLIAAVAVDIDHEERIQFGGRAEVFDNDAEIELLIGGECGRRMEFNTGELIIGARTGGAAARRGC